MGWGRLTSVFRSGVKKLAVKAKKLKLRVKTGVKKVAVKAKKSVKKLRLRVKVSLKKTLGKDLHRVKSVLKKGGSKAKAWIKRVKAKLQIKGKKVNKFFVKIQKKLKTTAKKTTSWWGRLTSVFRSGVKKLAVKAKKLKLRVKSVAKKVVKVHHKIHVKKILKKHANAAVKYLKGKFGLAKKLIKIQVKKVRAAKKVVVIRAKAKFLELEKILNVAKNLKFKVHKFRVMEATKRHAKRATRKAKKILISIKKGKNASFIKKAKMSVIK